MGVGYAASALHKITYFVLDETPSSGSADLSKLPPIPGLSFKAHQARFYSPPASEIISWRDKLAVRYRDQLGEVLWWDEVSGFSKGEDAPLSGDVLLHYVAVHQQSTASPELTSRGMMNSGRAIDGAERRGFPGCFPQLLLAGDIWLPFRRSMIIEEPDWNGKIKRFGSIFNLAEEIRDLRALIDAADPRSGPKQVL